MRRISLFALLALMGVYLAACGSSGSLSSSTAAKVGGVTITQATVDHWLPIIAAQQSGTQGIAVPDAPNFTNCIAAGHKENLAQKGTTVLTNTQLKAQCQEAYNNLVQQTVQFLVTEQWSAQSAKAHGITFTPAQVTTAYNQEVKSAFPNQAQYQTYLKDSGMTTADVVQRVQDNLLANALRSKIIGSTAPVTQAELQSYYTQHETTYKYPQRRTIQLILVSTKAEAQTVLQAVTSGQSWATVAAKYSVDPTAKTGGVITSVIPGEVGDSTFATAAFKAPIGKIEGPYQGAYGYYVYRVTASIPNTKTSLSDVANEIKQVLTQQEQQKALNQFVTGWEATYRKLTSCGKAFYVKTVCGVEAKS